MSLHGRTWCPAQDLKQEPPKYKSTVLPLQKHVELFCISNWVGSITFQSGHTKTRSNWKWFINRIPDRSQYWNLWEQNEHTDGLQWTLFTVQYNKYLKNTKFRPVLANDTWTEKTKMLTQELVPCLCTMYWCTGGKGWIYILFLRADRYCSYYYCHC